MDGRGVKSAVSPPEIEGELRVDDLSRQLYSTDSSIYQVHPQYVCIPASVEDLRRVVEWADEEGLPVTPRGAGTSLSGQAVGSGVVVDCSRHLDDRGWADGNAVRVQPGVILDHLNEFLGEKDRQFGPDVAPSSRANLGGMIGNNSAGAHSIRYGHTAGHVRSLDCVLANGDPVTFRPISRDRARQKARGNDREARLYREIPSFVEEHAGLIRERYPDTRRNSSGYGLDRFLDQLEDGVVDFTQLVCGSEGSLATVTEAELETVPAPSRTGLLVYHADNVLEAMEVNRLLVDEADPYAVELIDDTVLDLARQSGSHARKLDWVEGTPRALLMVELATFEDSPPLEEQVRRTERMIRNAGFQGPLVEARTEDEMEDVWAIRKAGLPLLLGLPGNEKPTTFVEDTAVDPARLAEYVEEFQQLVEAHGTTAAFYGHASVGCLHIRPLVNLKSEQGVEGMRDLAEDAFDLVLDYNGAISGEHGSGRARSEFLDEMYGEQLVDLFGSIKHLFDPQNTMNPGTIVDPEPMTEHLRFGPQYESEEWGTVRDFSDEEGFSSFVELCNGNGACRKEDDGIMCPSYMVTREEKHSTRGRANALRGLLDGDLDPGALTDGTMEEVMELCISCKGCKSECPTGVDMAPMKEEVMHRVHQEKGASLRARFFAEIGPLFRTLEPVSGLLNLFRGIPGAETLFKKSLGIASNRTLPSMAPTTFPFHEYPSAPEGLSDPVLLHVDTFSGYVEPEVARSAADVLERCGFDVVAPRLPDSGRPMMSKGFLDRAANQVTKNLEILAPFAREGIPIVGLEPSCVSAFTDDYVRFSPGSKSEVVAERTQLFTDFLNDRRDQLPTPNSQPSTDVLIHGHCHQESLWGMESPADFFETWTRGGVQVLDSGCCGMAGSFGFEEEHVDHSRAMGERVLLPAVRDAPESTAIVASGTSCRQQIRDETERTAIHPAVLLDQWTDAMTDSANE